LPFITLSYAGIGSPQPARLWRVCHVASGFHPEINVIKLQLKPCRLCNMVELERRRSEALRALAPMVLTQQGFSRKGFNRAFEQ
jgi:hypothetical protein